MLCEAIHRTPRIINGITDVYSKKVWFLMDMHQIWIKPHGIKKSGWYVGSYRMTVEDVEQIIKEWPKEWQNIEVKSDDDTESEKDSEEPPPDPEKGKEKLGDKRMPGTTKLAPRKKLRLLEEPAALHLVLEEVEGLIARIQERIDQPITKMLTTQTAIRSVFEAQFAELRSMVEKVAQSSLTTPSRSESGTSHPKTSKAGKSRIVQIHPMMISLPTRVEVADLGPIEIDLARVPLKTLNLVQREVVVELQERKQGTYQANEELRKTTKELRGEAHTLTAQAEQHQKEEAVQEQAITTICTELLNCPIDLSTPLAQKFKIVAGGTKELERYIEKMDVEHQKRIAELEACQLSTPPEECNARALQLKAVAEQMEVQVNVVIGLVILSQTLSIIVLKSSSCNIAWYVGLATLSFFLSELPSSIVPGRFSPTIAFPLSFSFACSFSCPFSSFFSLSTLGLSSSSITTHISSWSSITYSISSWVIL